MAEKIKRVTISEKDRKKIETIGLVKRSEQPRDYGNKIVLKPWGYEYLLYENKDVAIWMLHVKKDQSTSMHAHPHKKTSLIVLVGSILCNTFFKRNFMDAGEAVVIEKGVFHMSKTLSLEEAVLMEIETPVDKEDLVRLNDAYGRINMGYEGIEHMVMNASAQKQYSFAALGEGRHEVSGEGFSIQISRGKEYLCNEGQNDANMGAIYCVLSEHEMVGEALDEEGFFSKVSELEEQTVLKISFQKEGER